MRLVKDIYYLPPTPIGLEYAVTYPIEMKNLGITKLNYTIDTTQLEQLNWLADRSVKGLEQSAGIMVNYRYELDRIESNHEAYRGEQSVRSSSAVSALLKS